ncbi:MAG: hypothetical protein KDB70_04050 [Mycobacterium sp.]|nr:hypothetical protein [Mycobacterium sp.]
MTTAAPNLCFYAEPGPLTPTSEVHTGWAERGDDPTPLFVLMDDSGGDVTLNADEARELIVQLAIFVHDAEENAAT